MTAHQYVNGNACSYDGEIHRYEDGVPISEEIRPCPNCNRMPTGEGYDGCLGYILDADAACCGHGLTPGYIMHKDGRREVTSKL